MPGPLPSRSEDLARPRERNGREGNTITKGEALPVTIPDADPEWHPIAIELFNSCKRSGQSAYYQDSDWWTLYSLCEDLSHYKEGSKGVDKDTGELYNKARSGQMLATIMTSLSNLLVTEGDRRRVRIELQAPEAPTEPVSLKAVKDAKALLGAK